MSPLARGARPPWAWIIVAHVTGAAAIGALDAARLHAAGIALAVVPLFAATGLVAAVVVGVTEQIAAARAGGLAAVIRALPALVVLVPLGASAFARTWPPAPLAVPFVGGLGVAVAIALGGRLVRDGDRIARAIAIMAVAGAIGALVWLERDVVGPGDPDAHAGITIALVVLAGVAVRVARSGNVPRALATVLAGIVLGTAVAASLYGLRAAGDRRLLAEAGDQARDLVRVWRALVPGVGP